MSGREPAASRMRASSRCLTASKPITRRFTASCTAAVTWRSGKSSKAQHLDVFALAAWAEAGFQPRSGAAWSRAPGFFSSSDK